MQNLLIEETLPLFASVASRTCARCFDTGIWLTPRNQIAVCPQIQMRQPHTEPNQASVFLRRAASRLFDIKIWISEPAFDLARILTNYSSINPCPRQEIFDTFYGSTAMNYQNQLRKFHAVVEELRKIWLLPIGSRKMEPSGYWIITDLDDFKKWFNRAKSAPITQLSTIHKVAKFNFPIFAEQIELEFWNDINTEAQ